MPIMTTGGLRFLINFMSPSQETKKSMHNGTFILPNCPEMMVKHVRNKVQAIQRSTNLSPGDQKLNQSKI